MLELKIFPLLGLIMHGLIVLHLVKRNFDIKTKPFRCEEFWFISLVLVMLLEKLGVLIL